MSFGSSPSVPSFLPSFATLNFTWTNVPGVVASFSKDSLAFMVVPRLRTSMIVHSASPTSTALPIEPAVTLVVDALSSAAPSFFGDELPTARRANTGRTAR